MGATPWATVVTPRTTSIQQARAAEHGESLKDLVNRAIAHELGLTAAPQDKTGRVTLPLIGHGTVPTVLVTNDDIEAALEAEDIERYTTG
jgi:hypothetical protein